MRSGKKRQEGVFGNLSWGPWPTRSQSLGDPIKKPAAVSRSGLTLPSGRLAGDRECLGFCKKRTSRRNNWRFLHALERAICAQNRQFGPVLAGHGTQVTDLATKNQGLNGSRHLFRQAAQTFQIFTRWRAQTRRLSESEQESVLQASQTKQDCCNTLLTMVQFQSSATLCCLMALKAEPKKNSVRCLRRMRRHGRNLHQHREPCRAPYRHWAGICARVTV